MKVKFGFWGKFADVLLLFVYNKARKNPERSFIYVFSWTVKRWLVGGGGWGETSLLGTVGRKGDVILSCAAFMCSSYIGAISLPNNKEKSDRVPSAENVFVIPKHSEIKEFDFIKA